jgi:uncharacterized membrane protein
MSEPTPSGLSDNAAGAIAYITPLPAIVFLLLEPYNKSSYVRFHSWQSIFFAIAWVVVAFVLTAITAVSLFLAPLLGLLSLLVFFAFLGVWLACVLQAVNGKRFKLPVLGDLAEKLAVA